VIYKITKFDSTSLTKIPKSPDQEFTFENIVLDETDKDVNISLFSVLCSHFILNTPLDIESPIKKKRRTEDLNDFFPETLNYLILDIDHISSEYNKQKVLEYFSCFKVIIGESRSFNGSTNFNLKGILFIENMDRKSARVLLEKIKADISEYCLLDEAVLRRCTLNAPILKNVILLNNESGEVAKKIDENSAYLKRIHSCYTPETLNIDVNGESIEDLTLKIFTNMGFSAIKENSNGSISFKHPGETKSPGGYFWFSKSPFMMHHPNSSKSVNIYNTIRKLPDGKELLKKSLNYDEMLNKTYNSETYYYNEEYLLTENKSDIITKWLEAKNGMLSIASPMGTAKSAIIYEAIEQAISMDFKILIVTNRISVAEDFSEKYNIPLYYNVQKSDSIGSLIIQYDSLQKYSMRFFDMVVLDEFQSLCYHARNNIKNSELNIKKFFATFKKKIIVADAFLTGFENEIIGKKYNCVQFINQYRNDTKLYEYKNKNYFFVELLKASKEGKTTISCTSLGVIKGIKYILEKTSPELKIITLTSETPSALKSLIYKSFDDGLKWDVLIYSPTLTVGVSILADIDKHFHFDGGKSANVISSIQMVKRTRKAKEIHYFVGENLTFQPTNYNTLRDFYISNAGYNTNNIFFECDSNGDEVFSETGEKITKIDVFNNIIQFNNYKAFKWLLKFQFSAEPIIINTRAESFMERAIKKCQFDMDSYIEDFFILSDIERSQMSSIKSISNIEELITYINTSDELIIKNILMIAHKNKDFIKDVHNFKLLQRSIEELQILLSNAIKKNIIDDIEFLRLILNEDIRKKFIDTRLKSWYSSGELTALDKKFLPYIGYSFKSSRWQINNEITKFKEYIL